MSRRRLAPVLLALAAAAVPRAARAQAPEDSPAADVAGPTVVVVAPPVTSKAVDADEDLATVLDDFDWHLALEVQALEKAGAAG